MGGRASASAIAEWPGTYGVDGFPHLSDPDGELFLVAGTDRSSFHFVDDDGTVTSFGYGQVDGDLLTRQLEQLLAT